MSEQFEEEQLPADLLAGKRRRIEALNEVQRPGWLMPAIAVVVIAALGGGGYWMYKTYIDLPPEPEVDVYQGVHFAPGAASKDAQEAIARFHASPAYAAAEQRALREMQAAASGAQQP